MVVRPTALWTVSMLSSAVALGTSRPGRLPHYEPRLHPHVSHPMTPPSMFLDEAPNLDQEIPMRLPLPIQRKRPRFALSSPPASIIASVPIGVAAAAALFASAPAMGRFYCGAVGAVPEPFL